MEQQERINTKQRVRALKSITRAEKVAIGRVLGIAYRDNAHRVCLEMLEVVKADALALAVPRFKGIVEAKNIRDTCVDLAVVDYDENGEFIVAKEEVRY